MKRPFPSKRPFGTRRGSALLVVLGMLSFMVISAVAFSAWMRYERLPSSFLLRSSSSRMLAKAAMSDAIDEIDRAIGNNPHPNVGDLVSRRKDMSDGTVRRNRNVWAGRVFIGTNFVNQLVPPGNTVSTLSLEGLAYIPPPLVNEARYYSRRSEAAKWHSLNYDSGRYAFCALDVSDYFDVNALAANVGRSSAPGGRISLGYVFENAAHTAAGAGAQAWDNTFMKKFRDESSAEAAAAGDVKPPVNANLVPLVSMADFNLALYRYGGATTLLSPFCQYVTSGNGCDFYSGCNLDITKQLTFVTDGYFPSAAAVVTQSGSSGGPKGANGSSSSGLKVIDIADETKQPFLRSTLKGSTGRAIRNVIFSDCEANETSLRLKDYLGRLGMVMLFDYLDDDDVPISLAIPEVERTPMICGIKQDFSGAVIKIGTTTDPQDYTTLKSQDNYPNQANNNGKTRTIQYTQYYKIDGQAFAQGIRGGKLTATVAYPFRRGPDLDGPQSFKLDGNISFFFTTSKMGLRPSSAESVHIHGDNTFPQFISGKNTGDQNKDNNGVFHVALDEQQVIFNKVQNEQDAVKEISTFNPSFAGCASPLAQAFNDSPILTLQWEQQQKASIDADTGKILGWNDVGDPSCVAAECKIPALTGSGEIDTRFTPANLLGYINGTDKGIELSVNAAISLRLRDNKGKTVDLVPATMADDQYCNGVNNAQAMGQEHRRMGGDHPLMIFRGGSFKFDPAQFATVSLALDLAPKGVMCADPRWNWAPEHWFKEDNVSATVWKDWLVNQRAQADYKYLDRDIFMATSDAGYLQSIYELAFLPRVSDLVAGADSVWTGNLLDTLNGADQMDWANSFADIQFNRRFQWVTYRPYPRNGISSDPGFEDMDIVSDGGGFKINPFSDSTNVVMAAFANTPCDWWAASVDPDAVTGVDESSRKNAKTFNSTYAFNEYNSNAKFAWKDLERVAANFITGVRRGLNPNDNADDIWMDAFDQLDWSGEIVTGASDPTSYRDYFCTLSGGNMDSLDGKTDDIYDVDRKFLYGYWRDCFAVKQQLFLVFVRAEPTMIGGGAVGQTPPPLGARAVALVWRDPTRSSNEETPHRTRMLFYRQFE